ncbi:immunity protein YezG family protein [Streptococcus pluranimalium]|uniref:immunity protein YezG family protein n=1 Tax=Streptococcus pluranimalium TaxID=82348 RepID=UPI0039FDD6D9
MSSTEQKIQEKIIEILKSVDQTIPVDWTEVYINIEMSEDGGGVFFDFKPKNSSSFHYSVLIPEDFNVDNKYVEKLLDEQFELGYELWKIFNDNDLPAWSSVVISYVNQKLSTNFDYASWGTSEFSPTDRRNFYKYKYLKLPPRSTQEKELFNEMEQFQKENN